MNDKIASLVAMILSTALSYVHEADYKIAVDAVIDRLEDKIEASENKWDDTILVPVLAKVRELLDVPDYEDE